MRKIIFLIFSFNFLFPCDYFYIDKTNYNVKIVYRKFKRTSRVFYTGYGFPKSLEVSNYDNDCQPWVSGNGKRLFFVVEQFNGPPRPGYQGSWDIYFSEWDSVLQRWTEPVSAGTLVNTELDERRPTTTFDGDTMFFARAGDIYIAIWDGTEWIVLGKVPNPVSLPPPSIETNPALSFDGKRLYFDRYLPGENPDIYVALNRHNGFLFDTVIKLDSPVNTPGVETRAFESADGQRLYFSNFPGGSRPEGTYGNSDLYVAHWVNGHWDSVEVVGPPINSDLIACTVYETPDGSKMYIGSEAWEGSRGEEDIWVAEKYTSNNEKNTYLQSDWIKTGELQNAIYVYDLKEGAGGVIYAATACEDTAPYGMVFKTYDGGNTWVPTAPLPGAMVVYSIAIKGDTVYAGTYPNGDIFKSVNGGDSWVNITKIPGAKSIRKIILLSDGSLLAGVSACDTASKSKIFKMAVGDTVWHETIFIDESPDVPLKFIYETSNGVLFAGGWTKMPPKIWRSIDMGETWESVTLWNANLPLSSFDGFFEDMNGNLWVMGWIHRYILGNDTLGGGYVFKSTDGGNTWTPVTQIIRGDGVRAVRIYTMTQDIYGTIYVGFQPAYDSVVYATTDGGNTWFSTGGLSGTYEALCLLYASDGYIYAGTTPNGDVFKRIPINIDESHYQKVSLFIESSTLFLGLLTFKFTLYKTAFVKVTIYNLSGRKIRTLINGILQPGVYGVSLRDESAHNYAIQSGIYFMQINLNKRTYRNQKLIVFKK